MISLFEFNFYNIKFSDLLHYTDIFEKFKQNKSEISIIEEFFHLSNGYISFHDYQNFKSDNGSSDDSTYYIQTKTGKSKVIVQDYIKLLNLVKPKYALIPYEYVRYKWFSYLKIVVIKK